MHTKLRPAILFSIIFIIAKMGSESCTTMVITSDDYAPQSVTYTRQQFPLIKVGSYGNSLVATLRAELKPFFW